MVDRALRAGGPSRPHRPNRTAAGKPSTVRSAGRVPLEPEAAAGPRSAVKMRGNEPAVGYVAAVVLAAIAVIFLTFTPPRTQLQPHALGPAIGLLLAVLLAACIRLLAHRILSAVLAVLTSFAVQTPHVPKSVEYLRSVALVIALGYGMWLTFHQSQVQNTNRAHRAAAGRRAGSQNSAPPLGTQRSPKRR